jgi:hypothetical protein
MICCAHVDMLMEEAGPGIVLAGVTKVAPSGFWAVSTVTDDHLRFGCA